MYDRVKETKGAAHEIYERKRILQRKKADFYNSNALTTTCNAESYITSVYAELHEQTVKIIKHFDLKNIFEIGSGNGVFAERLFHSVPGAHYCGFDFSEARVEIAKKRISEYTFLVDNIYTTELYHTVEYDVAVCHEVLEHLQNDVHPLKKLKTNTRVIFSVPNYDAEAHVRYFQSWESVFARYFRYVAIDNYCLVDGIFLISGVIK